MKSEMATFEGEIDESILWLPLEEVYPGDEGYFSDYDKLLGSYGYEIVVKEDEDGYQGDSLVLFRKEGRYGFLCFGWGSCSGCDALQACGSIEDVEDLRKELHRSITWGNAAESLKYVKEHDWQGDACYSSDKDMVKKFVKKATEYLGTKQEET